MRVLVSLVVLSSAVAFSQSYTYEIGEEDVGNLSGKPGKESPKTLRVAEAVFQYRIDTITFSEHSDRPCRIDINKGVEWSSCTYGSTDEGAGSAHKTLDLNESSQRFSGVQVCMNKEADRIKGVKLFVSEFEKDGNKDKLVRKKAQAREFSRPNCADWSQEQRCPAGSMLTGLKIDWRRGQGMGNTSDIVTGLSPICRSVVRVPKAN